MTVNDRLQWLGAAAIIAGHVLNAMGPVAYPWNIVAFFCGTVAFLVWAFRVANRPQLLVNVVAMVISIIGLVRAFG